MLFILLSAILAQAATSTTFDTACYAVEDFRLETRHGDDRVSLAGDMRYAPGDVARPTVLMITGSGDHVREQMISGVPMFGMIADRLARAGYQVVLTDPRGFGASTVNGESYEPPQWLQVPSALRIADNRAVLDYLASHPRVGDIIVLGHSEGAMIASQLAADRPDIDLAILLAGPALPGAETFARQRTDFMIRQGVDPFTAEQVYPALLRFAEFVASDAVEDAAAWDAVLAEMMAAQSALDEPFYNAEILDFYRSGTAWHRAFMAYDPASDLARLTTPVLAVYGSADDATPPAAHAPVLLQHLSAAGNPDIELHVLPDQDHFFLEFEDRRVDRHPFGQTEIADELIAALLNSLDRRIGASDGCTD